MSAPLDFRHSVADHPLYLPLTHTWEPGSQAHRLDQPQVYSAPQCAQADRQSFRSFAQRVQPVCAARGHPSATRQLGGTLENWCAADGGKVGARFVWSPDRLPRSAGMAKATKKKPSASRRSKPKSQQCGAWLYSPQYHEWRTVTVPSDDPLPTLQELVDGYVEIVRVVECGRFRYVYIVDEEGRLKDKQHSFSLDGLELVGTLVIVATTRAGKLASVDERHSHMLKATVQ